MGRNKTPNQCERCFLSIGWYRQLFAISVWWSVIPGLTTKYEIKGLLKINVFHYLFLSPIFNNWKGKWIDWICLNINSTRDLSSSKAMLSTLGVIHQRAPRGALHFSAIMSFTFHFLMPHWNTTGVKWLWWTTRDYGNNTLVKSSWNHPPHADSNVNIPWSDGCTLCVCLHWGDHSNVCSAGTCRGQGVLGFESHGCMKV